MGRWQILIKISKILQTEHIYYLIDCVLGESNDKVYDGSVG